jgi:hypothetical protein
MSILQVRRVFWIIYPEHGTMALFLDPEQHSFNRQPATHLKYIGKIHPNHRENPWKSHIISQLTVPSVQPAVTMTSVNSWGAKNSNWDLTWPRAPPGLGWRGRAFLWGAYNGSFQVGFLVEFAVFSREVWTLVGSKFSLLSWFNFSGWCSNPLKNIN